MFENDLFRGTPPTNLIAGRTYGRIDSGRIHKHNNLDSLDKLKVFSLVLATFNIKERINLIQMHTS